MGMCDDMMHNPHDPMCPISGDIWVIKPDHWSADHVLGTPNAKLIVKCITLHGDIYDAQYASVTTINMIGFEWEYDLYVFLKAWEKVSHEKSEV